MQKRDARLLDDVGADEGDAFVFEKSPWLPSSILQSMKKRFWETVVVVQKLTRWDQNRK